MDRMPVVEMPPVENYELTEDEGCTAWQVVSSK